MFGNLFKAIGSLFGGRDEEEERRRQQQRPTQTRRPNATVTQPPSLRPQAAPTVEQPVPLMPSITTRPKSQRTTQQELEALTAKHYDEAKKQARQGNTAFDNVVNFFTRDDEKLATNIARNRAVNEFNERTNFERANEVKPFIDQTARRQREASRELAEKADRTQRQRDYMEEWVDVASRVPIIGSVPSGVVKMGSTLAGGAAAAMGNDRYAADMGDSLIRMQLGMSPEEFNALDRDQRRKLEIMQGIDVGIAPLDFLGVGAIGRSTLFPAVKNAALDTVRRGAVSQASRAALREAARREAAPTIASGVIGGGLDAAAQQYLTGEIDPMQTAKSATIASLLAPFFNEPPTQNRGAVGRAARNAAGDAPDVPNRVMPPDAPNAPVIKPSADPGSAISVKPRPTPPTAITSPNRPNGVQPPAPTPAPMPAPQPLANIMPAPAALPEPPQAPAPTQLMPEQLPVEELAPPAPEVPATPVAQAVETPLQAQSRAVAEQTTPVSPQAVAEAEAALRQAQSPGRTEALDVPEGAVADLSDGSIALERAVNNLEAMGIPVNAENIAIEMLRHRMNFNAAQGTMRPEDFGPLRGIGADELTVDPDGMVTLYRQGDTQPGALNSFSIDKRLNDQVPYRMPVEDVIANTNSPRVREAFSRTYANDPRAQEMYLQSLDDWNNLEGEVLAAPRTIARADDARTNTGQTLAKMSDADLEKRFIQLRDYNNSGEISPDELAEFERLTVERMKRRGTYDDQVNEIVDSVNSGTTTIKDVPSVLRKEVEARTDNSSAKQRALDIIEGASSREDKIELYKTARVRGLLDNINDIPQEFRKEVLADTTGSGVLPKKAREQMEVEDLLGAPGKQTEADPRLARADEKAAKHIQNAKKAGVDYGDLVVKVTRNAQSLAEGGELPKDLTAAERKVANAIRKDLDEVLRKTNEKGITNEDMGHILGDYLPTSSGDELSRVTSTQDVANRDFGFSKRREYKLDDEEIKAGAEQALQDYLRVGELLDDLTPEQIDRIRSDNLNRQTMENLEGAEDAVVKLTPSDDEIKKIRSEVDEVIKAERRVTELNNKIAKGDNSPETLSARNEAINDAHEARQNKVVADFMRLQKSTKKAMDDIKKSTSLTPGQKKERLDYLEKNLGAKEYQTRYLQSYTRSNVLFQVPGRLADQANKMAQAMGDTVTGVIGQLADSRSFRNAVGRDIRGDRATVKEVMGQIKGDPRLSPRKNSRDINRKIADAQSNSAAGRLASRYRIYATAATELGSREGRPIRDTVSYFVAKAQAEGMTDVKQIARYVQDNIDSKEWKRVHGEFYRERNRFTGVPLHRRSLDGTLETADTRVDQMFSKIDRGIEKALAKTGMNRRMQREVGDAIRIPLVGFPRVIFNLGSVGFDYATFGVKDFYQASKIVPKDEASALRKALMMRSAVESAQSGAAIGTMGFMLGAAGVVSGAYPKDASERRRWESEGKQPFSIKMTGSDGKDHWFDVSRYIGPYAFPFLLGAQMSNGGLTAGTTADIVGNIAQQVSLNFGTEAVSDFFGLASQIAAGDVEGALEESQRYLPNMISMGIPLSGQLNATGRATDEFQRDTRGDGLFDTVRRGIQRKIPGLREGLNAKTDAFGKPLAEDPLGAFLPTYGGNQDTSDPIRQELARLAEAGVEAYPAGVSGNARNFNLKDAEGATIPLTADQQHDLNNAVKEEKAHQAKLVMGSPTYKSASDEAKGEMLKKLYSLDSSGVAADWAKQNGVSGVKDTAEKINNSLSTPLQQALVEYQLQGDKKKVWLDDIDNAANYYKADYENAKANGTLTYDDQHLDKKSSKRYKMVAAQTNKEFGADRDLIALYENTNKTEFNSMPDGDLKRRLLAFDAARAEKGVSLHSSDHSKPKYGVSGSGGGRGGRGRTTVSLPSIRGATRSSEGSSGKYDKGGRLFKPQLALESPNTVKAPKVPSISVKRGVHL